ncbi:branched-chain amino acid transport system II carrier protein [Shigella sonnei]
MLTFSIPLAAAVASCWRRYLHRLPGHGGWPDLCSCKFFAQYVPLSYRTLAFILGGFSMVVSNLGLSQLIKFVPVRPPFIRRVSHWLY